MSLRIDWSAPARNDLANLPDWRLAATIDAAVERYAAEGVGFVLRVPQSEAPDEFRLLIPRIRSYVRIRVSSTTLYVERVIHRP